MVPAPSIVAVNTSLSIAAGRAVEVDRERLAVAAARDPAVVMAPSGDDFWL